MLTTEVHFTESSLVSCTCTPIILRGLFLRCSDLHANRHCKLSPLDSLLSLTFFGHNESMTNPQNRQQCFCNEQSLLFTVYQAISIDLLNNPLKILKKLSFFTKTPNCQQVDDTINQCKRRQGNIIMQS